jgi:selenide,water dikinase
VLVGGGHSHALLIHMFKNEPIEGVRIILISDAYHVPYSGMLPGYLAGLHSYDETHIDLFKLCTWAGIEFVHAHVEGLGPKEKRVYLKGRPTISYDVLSIDIGSTPKMGDVPGASAFATGVKPVPQFLKVFDGMIAQIEAGKLSEQAVVIVGGGAAGVEVALGLRRRIGLAHSVHLVHRGKDVLNDKPIHVRKKLHKILAKSGVVLHLGSPVQKVEKGMLHMPGGNVKFDFLYWMTQASPAAWLRTCGLDLDEAGFILVKDTLQTKSYDNIFATGDIATVEAYPRPKAGVFAVRQAKPLAENLRLVLSGLSPEAFKPQSQFLTIIGTGDEYAVAVRGLFSVSGAWVWRWKVRIDLKFMRQFEHLSQPYTARNLLVSENARADWLAKIQDLPPAEAVVGKIALHHKDYISAVVTDPFLLGEIAVNHCANEILAAGGTLRNAEVDLQIPDSDQRAAEYQQSLLMSGVRESLSRFAVDIDFERISKSSELAVGLSFHGLVSHSESLCKGGLRKGDVLILTKPLGNGLIFAAAAQLRAKGRWVEKAIASMVSPGSNAIAVAVRLKASACIHVSRLGLAGHLVEMLEANSPQSIQLSLRLKLAAIPLLNGARECLSQKIESELAASNVAYVNERVTLKTSMHARDLFPILFDPQISGGFLFAIGEKDGDRAIEELHRVGVHSASIVGRVEELESAHIIVE